MVLNRFLTLAYLFSTLFILVVSLCLIGFLLQLRLPVISLLTCFLNLLLVILLLSLASALCFQVFCSWRFCDLSEVLSLKLKALKTGAFPFALPAGNLTRKIDLPRLSGAGRSPDLLSSGSRESISSDLVLSSGGSYIVLPLITQRL